MLEQYHLVRLIVMYACSHIHPASFDAGITMMTSSNGNIFRVTGPLCGEFTGPGEFPTQRPVTRTFDGFFDLRLNKRLSKQPLGWWFETPSWSLWCHCNVMSSWCRSCASVNWGSIGPCDGNGLTPVGRQLITWTNVDLLSTVRNELKWNSNQSTLFFIHENAFGNFVSEMAAILFREKGWVDSMEHIAQETSNQPIVCHRNYLCTVVLVLVHFYYIYPLMSGSLQIMAILGQVVIDQ